MFFSRFLIFNKEFTKISLFLVSNCLLLNKCTSIPFVWFLFDCIDAFLAEDCCSITGQSHDLKLKLVQTECSNRFVHPNETL